MTIDLTYGHPMRIDHQADMAYIQVRELRVSDRVRIDTSHRRDGVFAHYDTGRDLIGIELFLRDGQVRPESDAVVRRLLAGVRE